MNTWIALITSLPTENATARMRAWRNLKASGAAVLRDGVYLMPEGGDCRTTLDNVAADVRAAEGTALVVRLEEPRDGYFVTLFDRSADFANLLGDILTARKGVSPDTANEALKQARKLRKAFTNLVAIDFFPGEAQKQADEALRDLEQRAAWALSPDEPHPVNEDIARLAIQDYRGRLWATRRHPWVDRLACAWLIRRYIDPEAKLLWLPTPADCPTDALGFDFDGATFTHVGARVSFEVLLASFNLETPSLKRFGALVHFLDVGGVQPSEAAGIESILAGLRDTVLDDDQFLALASRIFDGLLASFEKGPKS
ncbi:chromate resistance protein ChrB domain-containing protein [Uliginosibacterium gangwonense]|uniref:chromate resistance protein ChrB domain-containing protein n=1 Tax=Uliginosibacterium gangwonense TaxID=392736 RepID=UPI000365173B|nr:chromate resistance protein ChrB domain-containing protein [Uliginosibacterium gangwonense]